MANEPISVQIKGYDDGIKTSVQQDYKEAVLFAKREAIERAGVNVKSITTAEDFVVQSDFIESQAEATLAAGYEILDVGYQEDGSYLVILSGEVIPSGNDKIAPIRQALTRLSDAPSSYIYDLGDIGLYQIKKAYFADENTFVFHHTYKNGVVTLENIKDGTLRLEGRYVTDDDNGKVSLDFEEDGSAKGQWKFFFFKGPVKIINARPDKL